MGGRLSAGGNKVTANARAVEAKQKNDTTPNPTTTKMMEAWKKAFPEGTYAMKGDPEEKFDLTYKQVNSLAVSMFVDGQESAKMYQQYDGEWRVEDYATGDIRVFKSPLSAARSLKSSFGGL